MLLVLPKDNYVNTDSLIIVSKIFIIQLRKTSELLNYAAVNRFITQSNNIHKPFYYSQRIQN